jgi:hypothetical protein
VGVPFRERAPTSTTNARFRSLSGTPAPRALPGYVWESDVQSKTLRSPAELRKSLRKNSKYWTMSRPDLDGSARDLLRGARSNEPRTPAFCPARARLGRTSLGVRPGYVTSPKSSPLWVDSAHSRVKACGTCARLRRKPRRTFGRARASRKRHANRRRRPALRKARACPGYRERRNAPAAVA